MLEIFCCQRNLLLPGKWHGQGDLWSQMSSQLFTSSPDWNLHSIVSSTAALKIEEQINPCKLTLKWNILSIANFLAGNLLQKSCGHDWVHHLKTALLAASPCRHYFWALECGLKFSKLHVAFFSLWHHLFSCFLLALSFRIALFKV